MASNHVVIRPAEFADVSAIAALINRYAAQNLMLARSENAIVAALDYFVVAESDGQFAGCAALAFLTPQMVEIRSLAVDERFAGKRIGSKIVMTLVERARRLGVEQVIALTLRPNLFRRLHFHTVERWSLSPKVWSECIYCPKFHQCDEIAMVRDLR